MTYFFTQPEFWQAARLLADAALQLAMAFIGTVAFSVLFSVPRRFYVSCGVTGSIGWAVYIFINHTFLANLQYFLIQNDCTISGIKKK